MKKIIIPVTMIICIIVIALIPVLQNISLYNSLSENGYNTAMYKNIVNGSYSKYDGDVGLHSYYLRYSFIDNGTMSYTRSSDYFEVDYNGKTILFNRSSCEMVKEKDKFVMKEDSSATCIKDTPSDDLINKVVEEYDKINN